MCIHVQVPVVATVIQKVGPDGQLTIQVEPPGPEHESDLANTANQQHLGEFRFLYILAVGTVGTKNAALRKKFMFIKYLSYFVHFNVLLTS